MTVMRRLGSRARRKAAVAPAIPQPMIKTSISAKKIFQRSQNQQSHMNLVFLP